MESTNYKPSGNLQGDTKAVPDRGYTTGVTESYGADLSGDACNCQGGFSAKSDRRETSKPSNQIIGKK